MIDRICDLHCDTLYEALKNKDSIIDRCGHLSIEKISTYKTFIQVMAMWSDKKLLPDEAFNAYSDAAIKLDDELGLARMKGFRIKKALCGNDIISNESDGYSSIVFAVEGGALLGEDISRVKKLWVDGVRLLTLVWAGINAIGGAHGTEVGLTDFGKAVVNECFDLGIIPDVSHASDRMIEDVLYIAVNRNKPIVATHSNSRNVFTHSRNLTDEYYKEIAKLGGVVGISMAPQHLCPSDACVADVIRHIEHYTLLDSSTVCLGCDFDGVEALPQGVSDVSDLSGLYEAILESPIISANADKIMYTNARNFLVSNL